MQFSAAVIAATLAVASANPFAHYGFGSYKGLVNYGIPTAHSYTFSRKTPVMAAVAAPVATYAHATYAAPVVAHGYGINTLAAPAIAYNGAGLYGAGYYGGLYGAKAIL